jgi:hypothetical protein
MINLIYKVLETVINKEQSGYLSPDEFNNIAHLVQLEIFRNYFEDINRDQTKENRGLVNPGFGNLSAKKRQRLQKFSEYAELEVDESDQRDFDIATLPEDLYFIDDKSLMNSAGRVIEEIDKSNFGYVKNSISSFSKLYPVYAQFGDTLRIYPQGTPKPISMTYVRQPKQPKWTYRTIQGNPVFDPSNASFQDFELHTSEFSNIALKMLSHFGINLREEQVIQIAEQLKHTLTQKDNS